MNAFHQASLVEQEALIELGPAIQTASEDGRYVLIQRGPRAQALQRTVGDVILTRGDNHQVCTVELKAERQNLHHNLYLESWSNLSRLTYGWMHTIKSDVLWYYFLDTKHLYVAHVAQLREWAFLKPAQRGYWLRGRIHDFPEKAQTQYEQPNDTYGWCVPIAVLVQEAGVRGYVLSQDADGGVRLVPHAVPCDCGPAVTGPAPVVKVVTAKPYDPAVPF